MRLLTFLAVCIFATGVAGAQVEFVDNLPGTWIEAMDIGESLNLADDGEGNVFWSAGNDLFPSGYIRVGNNGVIGWTETGDVWAGNYELPYATLLNGAQSLVPFWDDLDSDTGNVYCAETGDGTLVVEWYERPHYSNSPGHVTFQVQVFPSGPIYAQFLYQDVMFDDAQWDNGASATVGYQESADFAVQWSYNEPVIFDGDVLSLVPEPASLVLLVAGALLVRRR